MPLWLPPTITPAPAPTTSAPSGGQPDSASATTPPGPDRDDAGGAVEFDRVVPPAGNLQLAGRQLWLGPARSGQVVRFWADTTLIHLFIGGTRVKTVRSHLTVTDLAALPGPIQAGPATRMRSRDRVRPAQHRVQGPVRAGHRHHRRLPLLRRTGPMPIGEGQPVRQPRHLQPRLGQGRRHRRLLRRQQRNRAGLRLAHHQRRPLRLEPPRLGPSRRVQTRTLALGMRRDLINAARPKEPRQRWESPWSGCC